MFDSAMNRAGRRHRFSSASEMPVAKCDIAEGTLPRGPPATKYLTCQGRWELRDDAAMAARDTARRWPIRA